MPSSAEILEGLQVIANTERSVAVFWHGLLVATLFALALGFRPRQHHARIALAAPLVSVSVLAWNYGNPFNGAVFALASAVLAALGAREASEQRVAGGSRVAVVVGGAMIGFGWVYPHFAATERWWALLYEAPFGLIPCPTLSVVIGIALFGGGLGSLAWAVVLSMLGLFYGVFGAWRLGVGIDLALCAGSLVLLWEARRLAH